MNAVFKENCASCHKGEKRLPDRISRDREERLNWHFAFYEKPDSPRVRLSSEAVFNLTFPENSAVLCAPLDAKAGGRAGKGGHPAIFKSRADPRYQTVLKAVQKAKNFVDSKNPRYDSPNYKPRGAYLRAMKRYGIIGGENSENFSAFECDKKYWDAAINRPFKLPEPLNENEKP